MNAWLYARLSNDDDPEMDSLANQMEICKEFALGQGYSIAGSSFDDNVSGMKFNRKGLDMLTDAVEAGQVDAVIVKDLSRLGRHKIQTALFIDYLRQKNVVVISVTENLNTLEEQDDLIVGIRGLMNDFYAKDIGNKIRHGYREKQKAGLVMNRSLSSRQMKKQKVFSRISEMRSWFSFRQLPASCGNPLVQGSLAGADAAGSCSNE